MSNVQNGTGDQLLLQIGNGATPEVFTASCTINTTRSLDLTSNNASAVLADCVTPGNPAQPWRNPMSIDLKFSGNGVADMPSWDALNTWWLNGQTKNCKVILNRTGAQGGFTYTLPMVIASLQLAGAHGDTVTFTGSFEAAGAIAYAKNA